ncbi:unnamed protein product [Coccothraustes coccothraustes]
MQALTHAKDANVELSGAKRLSRAAFGRSRALESTATGTMLLARRSRLFASGSRRARPLLRREERSRTTVAFSAQPSNSSRTHQMQKTRRTSRELLRQIFCACTVSPCEKGWNSFRRRCRRLTHAKDANVELSGAKRLSRAAFGRSRALESTATGTMLLARRSRLFASGSRRARPAVET